tara:strand:+ start:38152 stop:38478 length:327 start_codon:yes stop_codon:yes gene_type:complete
MESQEEPKYVDVGSADQVQEGHIIGVSVGEQKLVLCRFAGEIHALDGVCSHAKGPLCEGQLDGRYLVCPWHGWEYDVTTGQCEIEPTLAQKKFAVKLEDGRVWVSVPD